ncbi:MAG TPA: hypothetical protein VGV35_04060 [Bryobacteraceae bacterium]|nr:hypothetical protein [Bryobacteraceae bacterium]
MKNLTVLVSRSLVLAALTGATLCAQSAPFEFNVRLEEGTITGKPYSATAVTNSTQTLGDGTRITRTTQVSLARDSEGRTRREQSMNSVGPWSTNAKGPIVSINDPVAQVRYVLQADGQTAVKVSFSPRNATPAQLAERKAAEARLHERTTEAEMKARAEKAAREGQLVSPTFTQSQVWTLTKDGQTVGVSVIGDGEGKVQREDLGVKTVEGVNAKGLRETRTIPVGQIGNDRPIQIVSESWYSDDLQAMVYSKRTDPRTGESEYRLTNISRNEPPRTLFEVPAGYTVKEEGREPRRD